METAGPLEPSPSTSSAAARCSLQKRTRAVPSTASDGFVPGNRAYASFPPAVTVHDPSLSATESGANSVAPGRAARYEPAVTIGQKTSFQAPEPCQQTQEPGHDAG